MPMQSSNLIERMRAANWPVSDSRFAESVRQSFAMQQFLEMIGAKLETIEPGACVIRMPVGPRLGQQHGYVHGGVIAAIADTAGGYAALSLMPSESSVVTVEFKINFLAPGRGQVLVACGSVVHRGKTLSIVQSDVFALEHGAEVHITAMQASMIRRVLEV